MLYHGTNQKGWEQIRATGLDSRKGSEVWNCSGDATYFWTEDDSEQAIESAQLAAALHDQKDGFTYVLEYEPSEEDVIEEDNSTRNRSGAVVIREPKGKIVNVRRFKYTHWAAPLIINLIKSNNYIIGINQDLLTVASMIKEFDIEEISELCYEIGMPEAELLELAKIYSEIPQPEKE
jgi:hypothetical protein